MVVDRWMEEWIDEWIYGWMDGVNTGIYASLLQVLEEQPEVWEAWCQV